MRKLKKMFRNEKIELNQYEMMIVSELVNPEKLDIALDDVGGLKSEKQRLVSRSLKRTQFSNLSSRKNCHPSTLKTTNKNPSVCPSPPPPRSAP